MRWVFIGVVSSGRASLQTLLETGGNVAGIFTADKEGMARISGMHPDYFVDFTDLALKYEVPLCKITNTSVPLNIAKIKQLEPDIILCIGWPQVIKRDILQIPRYGCIGIHPTLLPERRGGAPLNWCLIDGLNQSGVSLFYLEAGVDSGDIIAQKKFRISLDDTAQTLVDRVEVISAQLIEEYYPVLEKGQAPRIPQDNTKATYARRRKPEDGIIDWRQTSLAIYNKVRALTIPFPGAFTCWNGNKIVVWTAGLVKGYKPPFSSIPGKVLDVQENGVIIATGDHCILVKTIGFAGESISASDFVKKFTVKTGDVWGEGK